MILKKILLEIFDIYKVIIAKINELDGKNYEEKYNEFIKEISNGKSNYHKPT